jgi:hypothetical protein
MIIQASVKSKAFKHGWAKDKDLRDLCGHLALDCTNQTDAALLTAMWKHCFGRNDNKGSIKVYDSDGKEVMHYFYEPKP